MTPLPRKSSRAEKRALWEVRQRFKLQQRGRSSRRGQMNVPTGNTAAAPRTTPLKTAAAAPPRTPRPPRGSKSSPGNGGRWVRRLIFTVVLLIVLSGGVFGYKILAASNKISTTDRSLIGQLTDLFFSQGRALEGETEGRVNIMLTAIGGEGHKGQNLADTIMIASIRPEDNTVALLSIPRDLYVQVPGESYYSKINAVHAHGESIEAGQGPELLVQSVEEVTGVPIHYFGRVDFTAFKQIIDTVGGIDITIDNTFFDYWHKISFSAGTERMDGERALAYVRARYIEGPEGGDFKRAARQQQVLLALRDKVFSVNTAFDFSAINDILNSLSDNIRTDMQLWEMKRFYEIARQLDRNNIHSTVLTTGPTGSLIGTTEILGGAPASVLKPRTGDYSEIHEIARDIFSVESASNIANVPTVAETPPADGPQPTSEAAEEEPAELPKPTVEIRNGTNTTGLAKGTSDRLTGEGYEVLTIGNAATRDTAASTVYALSNNFTNQAKVLADLLGAATDSGLPSEESASDADVLVILGTDAS